MVSEGLATVGRREPPLAAVCIDFSGHRRTSTGHHVACVSKLSKTKKRLRVWPGHGDGRQQELGGPGFRVMCGGQARRATKRASKSVVIAAILVEDGGKPHTICHDFAGWRRGAKQK